MFAVNERETKQPLRWGGEIVSLVRSGFAHRPSPVQLNCEWGKFLPFWSSMGRSDAGRLQSIAVEI